MYIYAIAEPGSSIVKIGRAQNLRARLQAISNMSPVPLEVRAYWTGGAHEERNLHLAFLARHSHGEWFDFTGADAVALISRALGQEPGGEPVEPVRWKRLAGTKQDARKRQARPPGEGARKPRHADPRPGFGVRYTTTGVAQEFREYYCEGAERCQCGPLAGHDWGRLVRVMGSFLEPVEYVYSHGSGGAPSRIAVPRGSHPGALPE